MSYSVRGRRQSKTTRKRLSIRLLMDTKTIRRLDLSLSDLAPMDTQQALRRIPKVRFRVLIIGRANAGKTSILQRVCETTNSPIIHRERDKVRGSTLLSASLISLPTRLNLNRPWMLVTIVLSCGSL